MKLFKRLFSVSIYIGVLLVVFGFVAESNYCHQDENCDATWGFFGHRLINRQAVFSLPPEMMRFFRKNIEYLTDHAVDPDKRRYATKHEAVRHYIDLDVWGAYPYKNLPRDWTETLVKFTQIYVVNQKGDTLYFNERQPIETPANRNPIQLADGMFESDSLVDFNTYKYWFRKNVQSQYYEDDWIIDCDSLYQLTDGQFDCQSAFGEEEFSKDGILPYHLEYMQFRLTKEFERGDFERALRTAAEFGHYIGDAHVPLHTTVNYNGQLTNQRGIHAFWESRLPELYAEDDYDFWVGASEYIEDPQSYFWDIVLTSHTYVDSVLIIERDLYKEMGDRKYCFEQRGASQVRTECQEYAAAYHDRLKGMVERRMRDAILSVASVWYTAWVDAGQPNLSKIRDEIVRNEEEEKELESAVQRGKAFGRKHD